MSPTAKPTWEGETRVASAATMFTHMYMYNDTCTLPGLSLPSHHLNMRTTTRSSTYQHVDEENGNEYNESSPQQVGDWRERNIE